MIYQVSIEIEKHQLLEPEAVGLSRQSGSQQNRADRDHSLGVVEKPVNNGKLSTNLPLVYLLLCEVMSGTELGCNVIAPPDQDDMYEREPCDRAEDGTHG